MLTREELLVLLIEECGEIIQAATKCLRFGYDSSHSREYGTNKFHLATELGEARAIIDELKLNDGECYKFFIEGWTTKIKRAEEAKEKYGI